MRSRTELLTDILDPNRSVEGNYRQYVVTTKLDSFSPVCLPANRTAIELLDSDARRHVILRENIDELVASQNSIMPKALKSSSDELLGIRLLSQQGRFVTPPLVKRPRPFHSWHVLQPRA